MSDAVYPKHLQHGALRHASRLLRVLVRQILGGKDTADIRATLATAGQPSLRKFLWSRYMTRRPGYEPIALTNEGPGYLRELQERGIFRCTRSFSAVSDYIKQQYFGGEHALPVGSKLREVGLTVSHSVTLADRRLHEILFDPELCAVVANYYGRQPFYRDNPTVHRSEFGPQSRLDVSGVFHSDGYRQISFMLLLNDLSDTDTHMQYAVGSHRRQQPTYDRSEIDQAAVARSFEIANLTGPKGTLYVFDTEGLHRGEYFPGSIRDIFHTNINTGVIPFTDEKYASLGEIFDQPDSLPRYIRDMVVGAIR